ncbi:MAG: tetratricopeptide repeat protein [candidate division WOR-3 bacterium]
MILIIFATLAEAVELYNTGNKFYCAGDYAQAIQYYENALKVCEDKDIYYNLGNAYFKNANLGKALIQYRRAYFLCPRDEDVIFNLNFIRNFRPDRTLAITNPLVQFLDRLFHYFSARESAWLSALAFFFASVFLSFFLIRRQKFLLYLSFLGLLFFGYFIITWALWEAEKNARVAVVIVPELKAFSGPGAEYKEILAVHDGAEARIREERNGYYLIQLPGGIGGWVKKEGVERIFE